MRRTTGWAAAAWIALGCQARLLAEEAAQPQGEEIVVTGSYIKGTAENAALPVDVTTAEDLQDLGNPTIIETVRNLAYTSGNLAESNQFGSSGGSAQGGEGVTTINLRGLGGTRTLVLINGHRQVGSEASGVDVNILPGSAIGRLEVLKDGAAALYGSDAIAGVVNLITREGFEGLEIRGSEQFIDESDGDHEAGIIWGASTDTTNFFIAGEWQHRSELRFRDREWGIPAFTDNPQAGYSSIANPANYFQATATGTLLSAGRPDPECANLAVLGGGTCFFQFTQFDNITEEQDNYKGYAEINVDLGDGLEWHSEALVSQMDMHDNFKTSPSYPPQSLFGPDRLLALNHPALIDFKQRYPQLFPTVAGIPAAQQSVFVLGRMIGVEGRNGEPSIGSRQTKQHRFSTSLTGGIGEGLSFDIAATYSDRERYTSGYDMSVERMAFALDGLGGPDCDPATGTPGVGPCLYFNPFSTAIDRSVVTGRRNPNFVPALDNPRVLESWLIREQEALVTNKLLVLDAVLTGEAGWELGGGPIGWAAGVQTRNEHYDLDLNSVSNLEEMPCPFSNPASVTLGNISPAAFNACLSGQTTPTGPLAFLAGAFEQTESRTVYAAFTEWALPVTETIDVQLALRYEDYGGEVGNTIDPKLAVKWQALDWLALRASAGSTFRGPPQSYLGGRGTALVFITPTSAFKAVDTVGNPDLKPESADTTNFGIIIETGGLYASVDYWSYDFTDPFQTEAPLALVAAYQANACQDGGAGAATAACQQLRAHIFPTGVSAAALERVEVNIINGGDIETSGVDGYVQYTFDEVFGGELTIGGQGTYTIEYKSDDFSEINGFTYAKGGDFVGLLNDGTVPFTPKPELKGDLFLKYSSGIHSGTLVARYVDEYEDAAPPLPSLDTVDSIWTYDAHYILRLFGDSTVLAFSVLNLSDEDPPQAATDLNYDPFTHDPRGRVFKLGITYTMGGT